MKLIVAAALLWSPLVLGQEDRLRQAAELMLLYVTCAQVYGEDYAPSAATPTEIAEAALDACKEFQGKIADNARAYIGNRDASRKVADQARDTARAAAVRAVIEARYKPKP